MPFTSLGLAPELVRAVADEGYEQPTPIQQEAIPLALAGRDLIGSAQTGTGKTAAFMLPILQRLSRNGVKHVLRALILVPTRELAEQVLQSARAYGRHLDVSAAAIYGGVGMEPQTRALARGTDIVVATPGRLLDHMERGHVDFSRLEVLVLDEADRMLDMGFAPDVRRILRALPAKRQTMLFSATVSLEVDALARTALDSHASVEIGRRATPADGIRMVVNFDVPHEAEVYVHRVGRTARAGARGLALTLLSPDEWLLMGDIEKLVGQIFPREVIPGFEPSVPPLQPRALQAEQPKQGRSVRARTGGRRRR